MGYYHAAMARLYAEQGILRQFPWMPFSELAEHFVDQHWLYNLSLVPFTWVFDTAQAVTAGGTLLWLFLLLAVMARLLREQEAPFTWIFLALTVLAMAPFAERLLYPRPMAASTAFLALFLWALYRRSPKWLFVVAFFYGWLYHAAIQILGIAAIYMIFLRIKEGKWRDRLLLAPFFGFSASLILNPFFPASLPFFIRHTFFLSHARLGVALPAEWEGLSFSAAFLPVAPEAALLGLLLLPFLFSRRWPSIEALHLLALSMLYFAATMKAVRFFEYLGLFPPLAVALLVRDMPWRGVLPRMAALALVLLALILGTMHSGPVLMKLRQDAPFTEERMGGAANYLKANIPGGQVLFNVYSGDFPELFYHAPEYFYTEGFNHTLMAFYNPDLYKNFIKILKDAPEDSGSIMIERFHSRFVVFSRLSSGFAPGLMKAIEEERGFRLLYQDNEALVAEVVPKRP